MTANTQHIIIREKWRCWSLLLLLLLSACSDYEYSIYDPLSPNYIDKDAPVAEEVDLGLSVNWASWNVGATVPEDYGNYYAWGEVRPRNNYTKDSYIYYNGDGKYTNIGGDICSTSYDVAHVKWGNGWRMPTRDECNELMNKCSWTWTTINGTPGQKISGSNGKSIFLPAAGHISGTKKESLGLYGNYWTGSLILENDDYSHYLYFGLQGSLWSYWQGRFYGFSVRPVKDKVIEDFKEEITYPTELYIIGNDFGNWDWNADGVVEMTPVHSHPGHFWAIRHMTTATEFKFCALREWNGDFTGQGNDSGYIVPGNCMVEVDGIYMIYVDLENSRVIVEPANVYGIGDCFGSWDCGVEANKFVANGQILEATTKAAGNLRMYATLSTPTSDWWQMEFNIYDGAIVYRAGGNDLAAVPVTAGQKVTLDFNAGTGAINGSAVDDEPVIDETAIAEAVDLGLSVKWASWNVGATAPEEYGGYYAWGETEVKDCYDWSTYKWCNGDEYSMTKYSTSSSYGAVDNKTTLDPEDDAAHVKWGSAWRMPTVYEIEELIDECSWSWTSQNGVNGYKVIGPNGYSIFLPAAGYRNGTGLDFCGSDGCYWSGSLSESYSYGAYYLYFNSGYYYWDGWNDRPSGRTVRPVMEKEPTPNVDMDNYPEDEDWSEL